MEDTCEKRFEEARRLLDEQRDFEAEQAFSDIILLYPESEGAYGNRGLARMHLGRDREALEDFRNVVRLNPNDAMGYSRMGEALRNLNNHQEALAVVSKALALDDAEPDAHYIRGWLFAACGQYALAAEDLSVFVDSIPEPGEVEDMLAVCTDLATGDLPKLEQERVLAQSGFSYDFNYNENYAEEDLFCPYAHCIRNMPGRGPEAIGVCPVTGFECPGHEERAAHCAENPPI